jgi:hypothetical protein
MGFKNPLSEVSVKIAYSKGEGKMKRLKAVLVWYLAGAMFVIAITPQGRNLSFLLG